MTGNSNILRFSAEGSRIETRQDLLKTYYSNAAFKKNLQMKSSGFHEASFTDKIKLNKGTKPLCEFRFYFIKFCHNSAFCMQFVSITIIIRK